MTAAEPSSSSSPISVVLTAEDIPGAALREPYESHAVPALRWWLLCRGIKASTSQRKAQLISRIHQAIRDNAQVVDVDGSYLYKKSKKLEDSGQIVAFLDPPPAPITGWETVTEVNTNIMAKKIPRVTTGQVYTYLSAHASQGSGDGTFRALTRGYTHWASGRIDRVEVNVQHPQNCHVQSVMKPSMKPGSYHVWILLEHIGPFATIQCATCECAAGKSASCTHVSALLHALVSMTAPQFQLQPSELESPNVLLSCDEEAVPVTSRLCQWKVPRKRKVSTMALSEASFIKHEYGREKKRAVEPLEDFDPCPMEFRITACDHLPTLSEKIRGEQLCISLLFDKTFCYWDGSSTVPANPIPPNTTDLRNTVDAFKASLTVSEDAIRKTESDTRQQRNPTGWYNVRRYRLTASMFGNVLRRKPNTAPDNLVLSILQPKHFASAATDWGIHQESTAIQQYIRYQQSHGHPELTVAPCGFHISEAHPYLGATPDGAVFDASNAEEPFGFLEIKCPYAQRNITPAAACSTPGFCCILEVNPDGNPQLFLRINHVYYAQVQGQMAVGNRPWCDFVVYTTKGILVQRIKFDKVYWEKTLLPKLIEFYDNCLGPEIVSPVHVLGLPIRNLSK